MKDWIVEFEDENVEGYITVQAKNETEAEKLAEKYLQDNGLDYEIIYTHEAEQKGGEKYEFKD